MTLPAADPVLVEKLAMANRILFDRGVVDGFGHISVRHGKSPDHFAVMQPCSGLGTARRYSEL